MGKKVMLLSSNKKHKLELLILWSCSILISFMFCGCDNDSTTHVDFSIPPEIEWLDTTLTVQGEIVFEFRVEGNSPWKLASGYINGRQVWEETEPKNDTLSFAWDSRIFQDGTHALETRVWDRDDQVGISPNRMIWVKNDTTTSDLNPPVVRWSYPESGTKLQGIVGLPFNVEDDGGIRSIRIFKNGISEPGDTLDSVRTGNLMYEWDSETVDDGYLSFEIFAYDSASNLGRSPVLLTETVNQSLPQTVFIPADYPTIQSGINAVRENDIIRVSPGTYYEGLNFFGKNVWLESTHGPEQTIIDASGWARCIYIVHEEDTTLVIRGFTLKNAEKQGIASFQGSFKVSNCIFRSTWEGIRTGNSELIVLNCIFTDMRNGLEISYSWGRVINNIIINQDNVGLWDAAGLSNPVYHGYNLFHNNYQDFFDFEAGEGTLFSDPLFAEDSYELTPESPCIDAGHPNIIDYDGTRSDIGVHGGPYAYTR
ncbi:MAG: NosD domain-containing protein [Candidatus Electryonea clarkiae]|nr:NosD domain-containing protein [Candidatus Electryonea clarkiae]MDP8285358.1 NosD domain-containing protein [Candidatus Electryonea clarkiae]